MRTPQSRYLNRELSWLDFNGRVLEEALDARNPILDRLKFAAIVSSNLDEFFMVRVAGLRQQLESGSVATDPAGLPAAAQLREIRTRVADLVDRQYACVNGEILPGLAAAGVRVVRPDELSPAQRASADRFFEQEVSPTVTPMAVDGSHAFPVIQSGAVVIAVQLCRPRSPRVLHAIVEVPRKEAPRFLALDGEAPGQRLYVPVEDLVLAHLGALFAQCRITGALVFRVTRDMDFSVDEEAAGDLLPNLRRQLLRRRSRAPVRVEVVHGGPPELKEWLCGQLGVSDDVVYTVPGPVDLARFWEWVEKEARPGLVEARWQPLPPPLLENAPSMFEGLRQAGVVPLFLPYEGFDPVVRLLEEAAEDPTVLAIKQTLYRVSGASPVVRALQRAAEKGKQVTVVVEVKARFDEERNIAWALSLEESGVHVTYGIAGLKIHCKALLIVRREEGRIARYLHLSTGNYNDRTAELYTDIGLFVTDPDLCADAAALFNVMTGYSEPPRWRKLAVAPFNLRQTFLSLIDREARLSTRHRPGHITAKLNSLVDPEVVDHLYAAAAAGVRLDLIVRGTCCLNPAHAPDRIRVVSIIDRFLEHSRVYCFANGGQPEYYLSSADWMPRNLDRRIEVLFPVEDEATRQLLQQTLDIQLADTFRGRSLGADGVYHRAAAAAEATRSQRQTYDLFRRRLEQARAAAFTPGAPLRVLRRPRSSVR